MVISVSPLEVSVVASARTERCSAELMSRVLGNTELNPPLGAISAAIIYISIVIVYILFLLLHS